MNNQSWNRVRVSWLNNHHAVGGNGAVAVWDMGSMKNLLLYSGDLTNAVWLSYGYGTTHDATTITFPAVLSSVYQLVPISASTTYVASAVVSSATGKTFQFWICSGTTNYTSGDFTTTSTPTRYFFSAAVTTVAATSNLSIVNGSDLSAGTITISNLQLELGTLPTTYQATTDLQVLPNVVTPGTYDLTRGANSGAGTDDPTILGNAWGFDGVNGLVTGLPTKGANWTTINSSTTHCDGVDSATGKFRDGAVNGSATEFNIGVSGGYSGTVAQVLRYSNVLTLNQEWRNYKSLKQINSWRGITLP
jgi:hypothetical protein